MQRAEVEERVRTLLAEAVVVPREDVEDPRTSLREDLGMDSMDYVDLVTVLERELGHTVEREELSYVRTVGEVVDLVDKLMNEAPQSAATEVRSAS